MFQFRFTGLQAYLTSQDDTVRPQYKINDKINYKSSPNVHTEAAPVPPSINKHDKTSAGGSPALICTLFSVAACLGCYCTTIRMGQFYNK